MTSTSLFKFAMRTGACMALAAGLTVQAEDKPKTDVKPDSKPVSTPAPDKPLPSDEELRKILTPLQYSVTQENGTERPFTEAYEEWKKQGDGIYVDIVSGKPLFSSKDKFDAHCGWPAFSKPITDEEVKNLTDNTHGMIRTEVRSATADSHLGHVFDDGPKEMGGLRYCINAAAIRFIPKDKMKDAGYGDLLKIFDEKPAAK